jgi:outer membrane receptor protein involved in Fe transport
MIALAIPLAGARSLAAAPATDIPEIVVTGSRYRVAKQDELASVTVITATDIQDLAIRDFRDALRFAGNTTTSPGNAGNNGITIRGINSEGLGQAGGNPQPLTAIVIDGAQQSLEAVRRGLRGVWDVERVEVLRGPQATVQGRNAMAGAVIIETRAPTFDWTADLLAGADSQAGRQAAFAVSGPIVADRLAFRLAGETLREDADITYTDPGLAFLGEGQFDQLRGKLLYASAADAVTAQLRFWTAVDEPAVPAVSGPDFFARAFDAALNAVESRRGESTGTSALLRWQLQPGITAESATAIIGTDTTIVSPSPLLRRDETRDDADVTQDLRLVVEGGTAGLPVSAVAGVYGGRFEATRDSLVRVTTPQATLTIQDLAGSTIADHLAVYADGRWWFAGRWEASLGARYVNESFTSDFLDRRSASRTRTDNRFDAWLPRAGLSYDLTSRQTVGVSVARGFRGGFAEQVDSQVNRIAPEYLTAWEVAYRSTWRDGRLRVNSNLFWYDWRDQQITVQDPLIPTLTRVVNAGESSARGAELEVAAQPLPGLSLGASVAWLDTTFDALATATGDFAGNEFPEAPRFSGGAWVVYRTAPWFLSFDVSGQTEAFATADLRNQPALAVPGRAIANAGAGVEHDSWRVALSVRNVFDREYLIGRDLFQGAYVGNERIVGIELSLGVGSGS